MAVVDGHSCNGCVVETEICLDCVEFHKSGRLGYIKVKVILLDSIVGCILQVSGTT